MSVKSSRWGVGDPDSKRPTIMTWRRGQGSEYPCTCSHVSCTATLGKFVSDVCVCVSSLTKTLSGLLQIYNLKTFPTHKGVDQRSKDVTHVQQQRPESPTVTLTWLACKYKVHVKTPPEVHPQNITFSKTIHLPCFPLRAAFFLSVFLACCLVRAFKVLLSFLPLGASLNWLQIQLYNYGQYTRVCGYLCRRICMHLE